MQSDGHGSPRLRLRAVATSLALALRGAGRCRRSRPTPRGVPRARSRRRPQRAPSCARRRCRSAGTRPSGPRATTCGSRATGASRSQMQTVHVRAARRSLLLAARALVLEGALDGQGQLALVEHHAGRRAPEGRRVPAHAPDRAAGHGGRAPTASRSCSAPRRTTAYVARYELLAGGKVIARGSAAPLTAQGLPCATLFTLRVRAVDGAGHVSALSPVAHTRTRALHRHDRARRARQRARDHGRRHERRARLGSPRTIPTAPSRATPCTATACCSASPARTGFLAAHLAPATPLPLHGRGHRRRRPPLRRRARST